MRLNTFYWFICIKLSIIKQIFGANYKELYNYISKTSTIFISNFSKTSYLETADNCWHEILKKVLYKLIFTYVSVANSVKDMFYSLCFKSRAYPAKIKRIQKGNIFINSPF